MVILIINLAPYWEKNPIEFLKYAVEIDIFTGNIGSIQESGGTKSVKVLP
jgi:hypothetical protein